MRLLAHASTLYARPHVFSNHIEQFDTKYDIPVKSLGLIHAGSMQNLIIVLGISQ